MHAWLRATAAVVALPYLSACSLFGPRMQTITVSSDPTGATVTANGVRLGNTPIRAQVQRSEDLLIEVRKPGYQTEFRTGDRTLSTLGILDVIGGWLLLVPFFGLLSSAAWKHEPDVYGIVMTPVEPSAPPAAMR
jgi:hypothetical protein